MTNSFSHIDKRLKMINIYEICGYGAGFMFALSLIPQVYKSYKTKNMEDISYEWQFVFVIALIMGLIYSIHYNLPPLYISSSLELFLMIILIIMKYKYRNFNYVKQGNSSENHSQITCSV